MADDVREIGSVAWVDLTIPNAVTAPKQLGNAREGEAGEGQ